MNPNQPGTYPAFFRAATGGHSPYPWQIRLAEDPVCRSRLIDIPTGLGKTAGVILAWLWQQHLLSPSQNSNPESQMRCPAAPWPRRLVYCLPMRTLVEQTETEVKTWLDNLSQANLLGPKHPRVVILMGGEDPGDKDWDLYPEEPAILIGTQDMLLSRALNRGYGMSRYRWPMHFALLNNDALWVMDEVQLMGAGLACTTQFEGLRLGGGNPSPFGTHSWWMSATIRPDWLGTVDFPPALAASSPLRLLEEEKEDGGRVEALRTAPKELIKASGVGTEGHAKAVAAYITANLSTNHLNLVVVNTVKRARLLHAELSKQLGKDHPEPILLHSQFKPDDRHRVLESIRGSGPSRTVVSTQVIEAGVDLSAHTLFTELAPWSSLVQRFGRCNRWLFESRPHFDDARIHWFDLDEANHAAPYDPAQLTSARALLQRIENASLASLETQLSPDADRPVFRHVLRRKDLVELFDTTPDLAGADLDIDRFVRDTDNSHVQVFWRSWKSKTPNGDADQTISPEPPSRRDELCSTGIGDLKTFLDKQKAIGSAWRWNYLEREWQSVKPDALVPGQIYLLHSDLGGYDNGAADQLPLGWTGDPKSKVTPAPPRAVGAPPEANEADETSEASVWQTVAQHTDAVCKELDDLLSAIGDHLDELNRNIPVRETLKLAARWHDWGKAHPSFQGKLIAEGILAAKQQGHLPSATDSEPVAKAPEAAWKKDRLPGKPPSGDPRRRHFRHELASALGILHPGSGFPLSEGTARDLAAYLVAAHHGKVRVSIRSLPDEWTPPVDDGNANERRFARGVWDGDILPPCNLGGGTKVPALELSLEPMELGLGESEPFSGQPSWVERALDLRDSLGPFTLAFLETLLRAADGRASKVAQAASLCYQSPISQNSQ
jgi:CRISPR-associated endonuclease/helicase Cas3